MTKYTVDYNDDTDTWKVTKRDDEMMPVDEWGEYPTRASAARSAANKRYAEKTRRPVIRTVVKTELQQGETK